MAPTHPPSTPANPPTNLNVKQVVLGDLLFPMWFQSIYPEDLVSKDQDRLYICRWCFRYSGDVDPYVRHTRACEHRTTPLGTKVYDHGGYSVWEVDGDEHKLFAQNISLFAKLFVDHKSVFFDVASFLFYILAFTDPNDPENYHILGYFSKEKLSWDANNLACILIFPPYQHKQLGKLLMGVSYKLSGWERDTGLIGGPEKPLSEMGQKSYVRFWEERLARHFLTHDCELDHPDESQQQQPQQKQKASKGSRKNYPQERMSVQDIGLATGMLTEDVITTLKSMGTVEPDTRSAKQKQAQLSADGEDGGHAVFIRKSKVLDWAKAHKLALQDPVREEGFLGVWAPASSSEGSTIESQDDDDDE